MKFPDSFALYAGILAPIVAFTFIGVAILTHPFFSFQHNALSDLGNPDVELSWIFNSGLIIAGLLGLIFAIGLFERSVGAERFAALLFVVAMIFLSMIGIFPEGTAMHYPCSLSFYLISAAVITLYGLSWAIEPVRRLYGVAFIIMVVIGFIIALVPHWDGIAIPETAGAIIIFLWVYTVIWQSLAG